MYHTEFGRNTSGFSAAATCGQVDMKLMRPRFGRAIAQAVSRRPLTAAAWVRAQVNPVGFMVDKVALGQVFLRVLQFSPVNIIPQWAPHFRKLKKKQLVHSPIHSFILIPGRTVGP
jgi:hypothetical protein